jgi:hypothetical protein
MARDKQCNWGINIEYEAGGAMIGKWFCHRSRSYYRTFLSKYLPVSLHPHPAPWILSFSSQIASTIPTSPAKTTQFTSNILPHRSISACFSVIFPLIIPSRLWDISPFPLKYPIQAHVQFVISNSPEHIPTILGLLHCWVYDHSKLEHIPIGKDEDIYKCHSTCRYFHDMSLSCCAFAF